MTTDFQGYANLIEAFSALLTRELDGETLRVLDPLRPILEEMLRPSPWRLDPQWLASEYADVFIINVPPYESAFLGPNARLWDIPAFEVWGHYLEHGYKPDLARARVVAPDHIGLELAFLSILLRDVPRTREAVDEFLSMHLLRWVPMMLAVLKVDFPASPYTAWVESLLDLLVQLYRALEGS